MCEDILEVMPPRRRKERTVTNAAMEEEMRQICARMNSMEETQRREPQTCIFSDIESENPKEEEVVGEEAAEE